MQQIQSNQEATCTWARTTTIMMKEYAWAKIYEKKRAVLLLLFDDTELQCRQLGIDVDRLDIKVLQCCSNLQVDCFFCCLKKAQ